MTKITVPCEKSSDVLTFHFFEERVVVKDQHESTFSIKRADLKRLIEADAKR
jgi:hypothetical protein